jgi:hypothetical protein
MGRSAGGPLFGAAVGQLREDFTKAGTLGFALNYTRNAVFATPEGMRSFIASRRTTLRSVEFCMRRWIIQGMWSGCFQTLEMIESTKLAKNLLPFRSFAL